MNRSLILSIFIISILFSCNNPEKSWSDQLIESENDLMMVTSIDLFDLVNKVDIIQNDQLSIDQKMMYKAFMSSLDNESLGFNVENKHRLFIVPEFQKLNAGIFLAGDVIDFNIFQNFLTDYFNVTSFSGSEPTLCYLEEFKIYVGFNDKNFVAAFSLEKSFAVNKIKSFFNSENTSINNIELTNYLLQDDDLSCYLSTEKLLEFINGIKNPFFKMQIPNLDPLKDYGSAISMALNFNVGNCTLSLKSNSKNNLNNQLYAANGVEDKFTTFLTDNNQLVMFGFLNIITEKINHQLIQLEKLGILDDITEVMNSIGTNTTQLMNIIDGQFSFSFIEFPNKLADEIKDNSVYNDQDEQYWSDEEFSEDLSTNSSALQPSLPSFIASLGIKDTKEFTRLLNKNNITIANDSVLDLKLGIYLLFKNKVFHFSSTKNLLKKIKETGGLNQYESLEDKCLNQPFYGCVEFNLDDWPKDVIKEMFKNTDSQIFFKDIKKVIINANNNEGVLKVQMTNEDQNSLKTIIDLILQKRLIEDFI